MRADVGIRRTLRLQPLGALGMGFFASRVRRYRSSRAAKAWQERRIVDLGIMRDSDERRVMIDIERRQRDIRPFPRSAAHREKRSGACEGPCADRPPSRRNRASGASGAKAWLM